MNLFLLYDIRRGGHFTVEGKGQLEPGLTQPVKCIIHCKMLLSESTGYS